MCASASLHGSENNVAKVESHPDLPDIAIVKLKSPVAFNLTIRPIALPRDGEILPGGTLCTQSLDGVD